MLTSIDPYGHQKWLENAARQGVPADVIVEIAGRHGITPESFNILEKMEEIKDPDGKSFFLIPRRTSGDDARKAALMTYILNTGTGYGKVGEQPAVSNDFPETPYSAAEVQRIIDRQHANSSSYHRDVRFVDRNGGRLVATPNGILMGLRRRLDRQRTTTRCVGLHRPWRTALRNLGSPIRVLHVLRCLLGARDPTPGPDDLRLAGTHDPGHSDRPVQRP